MSDDVEPPEGPRERRSWKIRFGATDASSALRDGSLRQSMDSRGDLELLVDPDALPAEPVDYLARVEVRSHRDSLRFAGHVTRAQANKDGAIEIEAHGAQALVETGPGPGTALDVNSAEMVYAMARAAGMTEEQLFIPVLDTIESESVEIIAPVQGIIVDRPRRLAGITLVPRDAILEQLAGLGFDEPEDLDELEGADAFAVDVREGRLLYDAEQDGLRHIDLALDWLTTRLRHAIASLPNGTVQRFVRSERRALPRRGERVAVRGLDSGRRWLRSATVQLMATTVPLADNEDPLLDAIKPDLLPAGRLALAACRRAAADPDPLARVQALWEAVEFLVAGVKVPGRWADEHLRELGKALPADMPPELLARARDAIRQLNQVPLMARVRYIIDAERLPCSDAEIQLLAELRRVRNDAAHGREPRTPGREDLDHATAIVCRLTVERLSRHALRADREI